MQGICPVAALAQAKWQSSTLTDTQAKLLPLRGLTAEQAVALGSRHAVAALYIPYFDIYGRQTKFYRLRYLSKLPGFAGAVEHSQKYAQAPGTLNEIYLPPLVEWEKIVENPAIPIYITEGELKAAAGCALGYSTIGLGGVDVWRSAKRGLAMLPQLESITWAKRRVVLIYDSDQATNPNVLRAQNQLVYALCERGAETCIAHLPAPPEGAELTKYGLDDFILHEGKAALKELLVSAVPSEEARDLWAMNSKVVYIRDPGMVMDQLTGQPMRPDRYISEHYSTYKHRAPAGPQGALRDTSTPKRWLEWPQRFELTKATYKPGEPRVTAKNEWNEWEDWGVHPQKGSVAPWHWLMEFVFKEDRPARRWFEQWLAYPLQHPGAKLFTACIVWSVMQGTGKTLIGHTMLKIYGKNGQEIGNEDLESQFNDWAKGTQFVLGDEVTGSDSRKRADIIKGMITRQNIRVNVKYAAKYVVPDCVNYFFTSNHPHAFFLEEQDRRFFVHELKGRPATDAEYHAYDRWYKSPAGAAALFDYFLALDTSTFNPLAPALRTDSRQSMIMDAKNDLGVWVTELRDDTSATLRPCPTFHNGVVQGCDLFSSAQLYQAYGHAHERNNISTNILGRELKQAGLVQVNNGKPLRLTSGLARLYAVRNVEKWSAARPADCAQHWDSFFGPKAGKF